MQLAAPKEISPPTGAGVSPHSPAPAFPLSAAANTFVTPTRAEPDRKTRVALHFDSALNVYIGRSSNKLNEKHIQTLKSIFSEKNLQEQSKDNDFAIKFSWGKLFDEGSQTFNFSNLSTLKDTHTILNALLQGRNEKSSLVRALKDLIERSPELSKDLELKRSKDGWQCLFKTSLPTRLLNARLATPAPAMAPSSASQTTVDKGPYEIPMKALLTAIRNYTEKPNHQKKFNDDYQKSETLKKYFKDNASSQSKWDINSYPRSSEEVKSLHEALVDGHEVKGTLCQTIQKVFLEHFPDTDVAASYKQQLVAASINSSIGKFDLDIESETRWGRLTHKTPEQTKAFIREVLNTIVDPTKSFQPEKLQDTIRQSFKLEKIEQLVNQRSGKLENRQVSTELTGLFEQFKQSFAKSNGRQIANFSGRFLGFTQEIKNNFFSTVKSLGTGAEQGAVQKTQQALQEVVQKASERLSGTLRGENPFATPESTEKMTQILNTVQDTFDSEYTNALAGSMEAFEQAFVKVLYDSASKLDFTQVAAGKSSTKYAEYLGAWTQAFAELSEDFANLHNEMAAKGVERGKRIGCTERVITEKLEKLFEKQKEQLVDKMFVAYEGHVNQLISVYLDKVEHTDRRSHQQAGQLIVDRAELYWREIDKAFNMFESHGVSQRRVAEIKLQTLQQLQWTAMARHLDVTKSELGLFGRMKEELTKTKTSVIASSIGGLGIVAGVGGGVAAVASGLTIATGGIAFVALAGVALVGVLGYVIYVAVNAAQKNDTIRAQKHQLESFFKTAKAPLDEVINRPQDTTISKPSLWERFITFFRN